MHEEAGLSKAGKSDEEPLKTGDFCDKIKKNPLGGIRMPYFFAAVALLIAATTGLIAHRRHAAKKAEQ